MFSIKLRITRILMTVVTVVVALAAVPAANSRMLSRTATKPATISGWIIFVGGPAPPNHDEAARRRSGTVIVRTDDGHVVAHVHATGKHGFRLRLAPGNYELYATIPVFRSGIHTVEHSCGIEPKVTLHAGVNSPVSFSVGCEIP
jgi:hypothetical protein